jgi:hypothetical protein
MLLANLPFKLLQQIGKYLTEGTIADHRPHRSSLTPVCQSNGCIYTHTCDNPALGPKSSISIIKNNQNPSLLKISLKSREFKKMCLICHVWSSEELQNPASQTPKTQRVTQKVITCMQELSLTCKIHEIYVQQKLKIWLQANQFDQSATMNTFAVVQNLGFRRCM